MFMKQVAKNILTTIYQFSKAVASANNQLVDWDTRPSPGRWSKKEIIGHLCDSAMINLQRFVRCTYEENFKLIYEQEEWVQAQHYQDMDTDQLLQLWKLLNLQIIHVLDHYPPDRLQAKCDNSKTNVSLHTVEWLAQDYLDHMQHHLNQIRLNEPVN
jgi:hypothetical protein